MPFYKLQVQINRQYDSNIMLNHKDFVLLSSSLIFDDSQYPTYQLEIISPLSIEMFEKLLQTNEGIYHYVVKEDPSYFSSPYVEINPNKNFDAKNSIPYTSYEVIRKISEELVQKPEHLQSLKMIKNRIGLFSDGGSLSVPAQSVFDLERDSYLLSKYTGTCGFPAYIASKNEDEFNRTLVSLSHNYSMLRISKMGGGYTEEALDQLTNNVSVPVLHEESMERAPVITGTIINFAAKNGLPIQDKWVALVGLGYAARSIAKLLKHFGVGKILGVDGSSDELVKFERGEGIATSLNHALENADILVILPKTPVKLDFEKINKKQLILSFTSGTVPLEKQESRTGNGWIETSEPHPIFTLPGLVMSLQKIESKVISQSLMIHFTETFILRKPGATLLPRPSKELIRYQIETLTAKNR